MALARSSVDHPGSDRAGTARTFRIVGLSLAIGAATALPAAAQTWNVDAGGTWGTGTNWSGGTAPGSIDASATLGTAISRPQTVTLGTATTIGTLNFAGSQSYAVVGSSLIFDVGAGMAALNSTSTATESIGSAVVLNDTLNANLTGTGGIGISGIVSGTGGLTLNGTNRLTLTANNTYAGPTTIQSGTLRVGDGGTTGTLGTGAVVNNGSLQVELSGTSIVANAISGTGTLVQRGTGTTILTGSNSYGGETLITNGALQVGNGGTAGTLGTGAVSTSGTLAVNRSDTVTLANAISGIGPGTGTLAQIGSGTTILTGDNSYGGTIISAGTLQVGNGGTTGTLGTGTVTNSGTLVLNRSDTMTLANALSGSGAVVQQGSGTTILTGDNGYTGTTTISAGTMQVGNGGTTGTLGTGTVVDNGTLVLDRSGTTTVANAISGTGGLVQRGTGTTILTGNNSYGGTTTISSGTLRVGDGGTAGTLGTGAVVNNGSLQVELSATSIVANAISGTGTLVQRGTGTTILTGSNSYGGETLITNGALQVGNGGTAGTLGTGAVSTSGTLAVNRSDTVTFANAISGTGRLAQTGSGTTILTGDNSYGGTIISAGTLQVGNGGTTGTLGSGTVTNSGTLVLNRSDTIILANLISGSGVVVQQGPGTTILTGGNSYSGTTTISGGTLQVGNGGTTGTLGTGTVIDNGTLAFDRSGTTTVANAISGTGGLVQRGTGTTILTGNNSYGGTTTIQSGTLRVGDGGTTGTLGTGAVVNNGSLQVELSATSIVANAISGTGTLVQRGTRTTILTGNNSYGGETLITNGALQVGNGGTSGTLGTGAVSTIGTLAVNRSDTVTLANAVSGTGTFAQIGSGTTILTGDNSYGGTIISAGTLQVGNGGTTGTLGSGTVTNSGTLVLNRSDTLTLANLISGSGVVVQQGPGTTILTGGNSYSGTTTISGGTLQVGNGGTTGTLGTGTVIDNGTLAFDRSGTTTVANAISGTGGLVQQGSGTTILTGNNTYGGTTTISSGALRVGNGGATGTLGTGAVVNNGSLQVELSATSIVANAISGTGTLVQRGTGTTILTGNNSYGGETLITNGILQVGNNGTTGTLGTGAVTDNGILVVKRSGIITIAGSISGAGSLVQQGTGTTILASNNSYRGTTTISAGTLQVGDGNASGSLGTGGVTNNGILAFNTSGTGTVGNAITGSGAVVQRGAGTTILVGTNSYAGTTTISAGTLQVGNGGTAGSLGTNAGTIANDGTLAIARSDTVTLANAIAGGGNLVQQGGGTTILTGNNSYGGTTTISAGTLQVGTGGTTGTLGSGAITNNATLVVDRSDAVTLAGALSGTGNLVHQGGGTLILTGNNSYGGATTVSSGTLQVGNGGTTGTLGTGAVTNNGALVFNRGGIVTVAGAIGGTGTVTQTGSGTTILNGNNSYGGPTTIVAGTLQVGNGGTTGTLGTGAVTNNGTLALNRSDTATVANAISGTGRLTQSGSGTTILSGNNSYGGPTTIGAGTLQVGNGGTTGTLGTDAGTIVNDGTLAIARSDTVTLANAIAGSGNLAQRGSGTTILTANNSYGGTTTISAGTLQVGTGGTVGALGAGAVTNNGNLVINRSGAITLAGGISGTGTLVQQGSGTLVLTGSNDYSGTTTIARGTLQVGDGGATGTLGTGAVTNDAILAINRAGTVTLAGPIGGSGSLVQQGPGTTILAGNNSYGGETLVTNGALQVGNGGTSGTLGTGAVSTSGTLAVNRSDTGTLANAVSGTGTLAQIGSGTTILTAGNSYGGTTISAGTLQVGNGGTTGTLGTGAVTNNGTLVLNRSDAVTLATVISGSGAVVQQGSGTTILTGDNGYTGTTAISAGTLQVGTGGTTGTLGTGRIANNATLVIDRSDAITIAGVISGTGALVQQGSGTTVVTGTNDYSGTTTIAGGTLQVGNGGATGALGRGAIANSGALVFNRSGTVAIAGAISGAGTLVQQGSGTTILAADNSYVGTTTISAGTLQVGDGGSAGTLGGSAVTDHGALAVNRADIVTIANVITGSGTLVQRGSGTTILTGTNSYAGTTTISAGTLQVGNGGTSGMLGSGDVTNNGTLVLNRSDAVTLANVITGSGTLVQQGGGITILTADNRYGGTTRISAGTLQVGTGGTTGTLGTGAIVNDGTLVLDRSGTVAIAGAISGTGTLVQRGSGTTILVGASDYVGTTRIAAGTLQVGNGGASGTLGTGDIVDDAMLVIARADALTVVNSISGSGSLVHQGVGTTTLAGTNDYKGKTIISAGTLQVGNGGTSGTLGTGAVVNDGTLVLDRSDAVTVANSISGSGALVQQGRGTTILTGGNSYGSTIISAGTLQLGDGGTSGTLGTGMVANNGTLVVKRSDIVVLGNAIVGSGAVVQAGTGTTNLVGTNTYTGPTTVRAGRLAVNGSITSDTTVATAGTLGGNGAIVGNVTNDGVLAPGNSIGTLNIVGTYTQAAGGSYQVELNAAGQADQVKVTGKAILNGGTVSVQAAPGRYARNTSYRIVATTAGVTGTYGGATTNLAFLQPWLTYDAGNVYLNLTLTETSFRSGALTCNQYAVGSGLDATSRNASGDYGAVMDGLVSLDTAQGPAALEAISGQPYAGFATANFASGALFANAMRQQMRGTGEASRVAGDAGGRSFVAWSSALGGTGTASGGPGGCAAATQTYAAAGVAAGADIALTPSLTVGMAVGYLSGDTWTSGFQGNGSFDSYNVGVYASYAVAGFYADLLASFGWSDNRLSRSLVIPGLSPRLAQGRTGADLWQGQLELGYRLPIDLPANAILTPFARFQAASLEQAAFTESGADALNLAVAAATATSLRSVLGLAIGATLPLGEEAPLSVQLRLGWMHEYASLARPVAASFTGAPGSAFTVYGAEGQRDAITLNFLASMPFTSRTSAFARYDGELSATGASHGFLAGLKMTW